MRDALAERIGPLAQREVIAGRGHVMQRVGTASHDRLERFLDRAQANNAA
jgi:hypothetical protein